MATTHELTYSEVPDRRCFTIGEAAKLANTKPHIVRYWEKEIPALIKAERRNGRRYYTREQVLTLQKISRLLGNGITLSGIGKQLGAPRLPKNKNAWLRRELEKVLSIL
ncbi:MAG: MerR family transcriptional regulator [Gammaproteobacteria bacterium WSBS_2016_MAG_OTU1]